MTHLETELVGHLLVVTMNRPEAKLPNIGSIKYYRPTGEPDAPYEDYKDYI